jgi:hypothetical protein
MVAAIFSLCALMIVASSGDAHACGLGKDRNYLVASGTSLRGVKWKITARRATVAPASRAKRPKSTIDVHFETVGYPESGFSAATPLKLPRSFLFSAIGGSYTDPPPESDFAGIAATRVASIVVTTQTGEQLTIVPQLAPLSLRRHICWMRRMRFFDAYFEGAPVPVNASAFDVNGALLGTKKPTSGSFF